jgi:uncharacterized protein YndB with AHSA1/START domain
MSSLPFVIERVFDAPINKVWDALTKNDLMKKWYFDLPDFKPVVGFEFTFTGGADGERPYDHLCRVTEVIPGKKLAYSWRYDGYPGNSVVSFELSDEGGKTRLRLTHEGLETFEQANPDFAAKNFEQGWTSILDKSLTAFLNAG